MKNHSSTYIVMELLPCVIFSMKICLLYNFKTVKGIFKKTWCKYEVLSDDVPRTRNVTVVTVFTELCPSKFFLSIQ